MMVHNPMLLPSTDLRNKASQNAPYKKPKSSQLPLLRKASQRFLSLCLVLLLSFVSACSDDADVCLAQCEGLDCGPDNCGAVCGVCTGASQCQAGLCVYLNCTPNCEDKACGFDGCGGLCGLCPGDLSCHLGQCKAGDCSPNCEGKVCGSDGCGGTCGQCEAGFGCTSTGQCSSVACQPECAQRACGADGCGGSCGTCPEQAQCNDSTGQCMPFRVTGTLMIETRTIYFDDYQLPKFDKNIDIPAARVPLVLYDSLGQKLGETEIDETGQFDFQLQRLPIASDWLSITPLWYHNDKLKIAILVANAKGNRPFDIWSWSIRLSNYAPKEDPGQMGVIRMTVKDGSGALYLYQQLRDAFDDLIETRFEPSYDRLPALSAIWNEGITWGCGTCYVAQAPQEVGKDTTESTIYIGGSKSEESIWGYPTVLHEFGHYVASLRRDDTPGGRHRVGEPSTPRLAWSEGFATFYSLMMQSLRADKPIYTYWRMLSNTSFWVDYSRFTGSFVSASPDPRQPMTQKISESWVTYMLWDFWDGLDIEDPNDPPDPIALGTKGIYDMLKEKRYLYPISSPRSVYGVDFVDVLDALVCSRPDIAEELMQFVIDRQFPYDKQPECRD